MCRFLLNLGGFRGECNGLGAKDLQLWVEEGEQPIARKMSMSMKWEGGSPRTTALMNVSKKDGFDSKTFEFRPPEGAQEIRFFGDE